jgi:hypothetical protein
VIPTDVTNRVVIRVSGEALGYSQRGTRGISNDQVEAPCPQAKDRATDLEAYQSTDGEQE